VSEMNPDLPILDELAAEFAVLIDADFGRATTTARTRPAHRRRAPARSHRRVARRSALILVLLCLIGGVAVAARLGVGGGEGTIHTSPTTVGQSKSSGWRLSAYRDQGRLCLLFRAGGELTSACGAEPAASGLRATSLLQGAHRFVVGLSGPRVSAVKVDAGESQRVGWTRRVTDAGPAGEAGVPAGVRWFVVPLAGSAPAPARVAGLDRQGHPVGSAYVDCSLGVIGSACERQIRARANSAAD